MRRVILLVALIMLWVESYSQDRLISTPSVEQRQEMIRILPPNSNKEVAEAFARNYNLPVRLKFRDGTMREIIRISENGKPLYYKTFNLNAAKTLSTNKLWEGEVLGLDLSGAGIVVGVWDGASILTTHNEFMGRARMIDGEDEVDSHTTQVAGIIGAAGLSGSARGMAAESTLEGYNWVNDNAEMNSAAQQGLLISNHSYGFIHGWDYNSDKQRWEWWGDESISETEDYKFGFYGEEARIWDDISYRNPRYLIIKAAGNDRGDGPAPGATHHLFSNGGWTISNTVRDLDGGTGGFDCIGTQGTAKNVLTVGAVDDIPDGYENSSDVKIASFSVFGPTDDGRIKPDIVGNGISLYSPDADHDSSYSYFSGTSASSPNVAGSLALLQQHHRKLRGEFMYASSLKALVIHTADEAGNPGPDYKYGWGLMNTAKAAELISNDTGDRIAYDTLSNQEVLTNTFFSKGEESIKVTIVWADPAGGSPAPQLDPTNMILVNDLDIRLTRLIDNHEFKPFVLSPASPNQTAETGDNQRDNVEQIFIDSPMKGFYELSVTHKAGLTGTEQPYSIIISGLNQDFIASGFNEKTDNNGEILLSSADAYINNMEVQWLIRPINNQPVSLYFDYFDTESERDILSVYDGSDDSAPLIGRFSGSLPNTDTLLRSTAGEMYITFSSNGTVTNRGFLGKYCTVAPEGNYSILGETYPCELSVESFFAVGQEGASFNWESDQEWIWSDKSENGIDLEIGGSQDTLRLTPVNRCGSGNESALEITPLRTVPELLTFQGDTMPCAGVSNTISVNGSSGANYEWELPMDWLGNSSTATLDYIPALAGGEVIVTALNACGQSNRLFIDLSVLDIPDFEDILTERVPPCEYSLQEFFVSSSPGYNYYWEAKDDWTIIGDTLSDTILVRVGASTNFLFVTAENKCGSRSSNRLFLTAPIPPEPILRQSQTSYGFPELTISNSAEYTSVRWYLDSEPLQGDANMQTSLVANRNGTYSVEGINDQGCSTLSSQVIEVDDRTFDYLAYRINESAIVVENATNSSAVINIFSLSGKVSYVGELNPGYNEIEFTSHGIYMIQIDQGGVRSSLKTLF